MKNRSIPFIHAAKSLAEWQKTIITKQKTKSGEIPHPAAAPVSTDQEAGGASSTPAGERITSDEKNRK